MRRATQAVARGEWPASAAVGSVVLDYDRRHRRRIRLTCEDGSAVLLDLEKATALRDGDGLRLEEGGWLAVRAAAEDLAEVGGVSAHDLLRICWHLGNRHCPAEILPDRVLIRRDHVIEEMLRGLGATVTPVRVPFDPERGAYDQGGHGHGGHSHGHGEHEDRHHHHHDGYEHDHA